VLNILKKRDKQAWGGRQGTESKWASAKCWMCFFHFFFYNKVSMNMFSPRRELAWSQPGLWGSGFSAMAHGPSAVFISSQLTAAVLPG
jgi:hypothetical protein